MTENETLPTSLTFGEAVKALKKGQAIERAGWNGRGMFVYMVPARVVQTKDIDPEGSFLDKPETLFNAHMLIKNVDGSISTWVPSSSDTLAEDWSVVNT